MLDSASIHMDFEDYFDQEPGQSFIDQKDQELLNYQSDPSARDELSNAFVATFDELQATDKNAFSDQISIMAATFDVSRGTALSWASGRRPMITNNLPNRLGGSSGIDKTTVFKMRAAYMEGIVKGQIPQKGQKNQNFGGVDGSDARTIGRKLRQYLRDKYTRNLKIRIRNPYRSGDLLRLYIDYDRDFSDSP